MRKNQDRSSLKWLQPVALSVTRLHFLYVAVFVASIIAFDSWNLIAHEGIVWRWMLAVTLLFVTTVAWYVAKLDFDVVLPYKLAIIGLILTDLIFAGLNVYWQRGIGSKAVALFVIPIIVAASLRSRKAILGTASLAAAAYSFAAVRYFHFHYGEGLKIELYGELGFYISVFFIVGALLNTLIRPKS